MPKKVTKKVNIIVDGKKQGYWVKKDNLHKGERTIKTERDLALVKRYRSGYDYSKEITGYKLTKEDLRQQFAGRRRANPRAAQQDLSIRAKNTRAAPIITAKQFFDFTRADIEGIDTPKTKKEAEFEKRVQELARKIGVQYKDIEWKKMKNIWGQATSTKQLRFNPEVLTKDQKFQDKVIVHELLHLRYPGHSVMQRKMEKAYLNELYPATSTKLDELKTGFKKLQVKYEPLIETAKQRSSKEVAELYDLWEKEKEDLYRQIEKEKLKQKAIKIKPDVSKSIAAGKLLYSEKYDPMKTHLALTKTMTDMQKRRLIKMCKDNRIDIKELDSALKYDENQEIIDHMIELDEEQMRDQRAKVEQKIQHLEGTYYGGFSQKRIKERHIDEKTTEPTVITKEDLIRKRKKKKLEKWAEEPYLSKIDVEDIDTKKVETKKKKTATEPNSAKIQAHIDESKEITKKAALKEKQLEDKLDVAREKWIRAEQNWGNENQKLTEVERQKKVEEGKAEAREIGDQLEKLQDELGRVLKQRIEELQKLEKEESKKKPELKVTMIPPKPPTPKELLKRIGSELPKPYQEYGKLNFPESMAEFDLTITYLQREKETIMGLTDLTSKDFDELRKGSRADQMQKYSKVRNAIWSSYYQKD